MSGSADQVHPLFSIVTPVYDTPLDVLRETISSVEHQTCTDWELILVDDKSPDARVREVLREAARREPRIRVIERATNGHIVEASNDGVAAAQGEFIALLDHDDLLTPRALERMQDAIDGEPEADYLYSDEDKIDANGARYSAFRKPAWSPERLRGQMYTSHLSVLRTALVREVGGFRAGYDGSQDHDLALRATEHARKVVHVPQVLYHWRVVPGSAAGDAEAKPYAWDAGRRAVQDQLDRLGVSGTVGFGQRPGTYTITRSLDRDVRISVVIPTRGDEGLVWGRRRHFVVEAVRSILDKGGWDNLEIVVVFDAGTPDAVLDAVADLDAPDLQLVPYTKPFNFSEKCNLGVSRSHGDVVVLLNDDVEVSSDGFLVQLVAPLFEDGVGMTGARLLFANTTIQHAGLTLDCNDLTHAFAGAVQSESGPFAALLVNRECSGLTGACVALRREVFDEVGGLCEALPINFNDVDLSCKLRYLGYRLLWIANATAYHFESQTRTPVVHKWESDLIAKRWALPEDDPYLPWVSPRSTGRNRRFVRIRRRTR
ncbi:MAG TPA: glycosyltransferase [Nocardioides sp.]|uniref:glycosyltransferase family 2 protein n=1 Tax=Nocardioides sp. TaxID=35761 RepID=UPI002E37B51E|nr:glycosyltransferase [Nocardioides sp.]HEX5089856.1 glycosyltransferase [Nocardioides sp.]